MPEDTLGSRTGVRRLLSLAALMVALAGCSGAGLKEDVAAAPHAVALPPAASGILADIALDIERQYGPQYSGFKVLDGSHDALQWRLALIDSATRSLDIQTYLWYPDVAGRLILERAVLAAQRGVRVRLIVDDLILQGHDQFIANLHAQPNIEFRLFNPWSGRESMVSRLGETLAELERLNSRMHDKLMIVDGRAAIVGGRNIGDHYYGLSETYSFHDTDLLGFGHIAAQANRAFDSFWNSEWVVDASNLNTEPDAAIAREQWRVIQDSSATAETLASLSRQPRDWSDTLRKTARTLHPGTSKMVFDEADSDQIEQTVIASMFNFFGLAKKELLVMNAYVIPSQEAVDFIDALAERGVRVAILTNSLASHDVPAVNSHYEPWRDDFIRAGVELYEFQPQPAIKSTVVDIPPANSAFVGLHSKSAVVDRRYTFIGSMNLDPRSANINTEMGAMVDSPGLAQEMAAIIERDISGANAWRLYLDDNGNVYWQSDAGVLTEQPARDNLQRVMNVLMKVGPEDQY